MLICGLLLLKEEKVIAGVKNNRFVKLSLKNGFTTDSTPTTASGVRHYPKSSITVQQHLTASSQLGISKDKQHYPSPSFIGLEYAQHNIFYQLTEREVARER